MHRREAAMQYLVGLKAGGNWFRFHLSHLSYSPFLDRLEPNVNPSY